MDFSSKDNGVVVSIYEPVGERLVEAVSVASGLPSMLILPEIDAILDDAGQSKDALTLEELRLAMMNYLENLNNQILGKEA
jgi:hypothetical protein